MNVSSQPSPILTDGRKALRMRARVLLVAGFFILAASQNGQTRTPTFSTDAGQQSQSHAMDTLATKLA